MAEYSVSTGDEGQHKCGRCRTFVESYDLMIGISSTTFGITGSQYWVHLDCLEQHQALELAESLDSLLKGYDELTEDDKTLVSESIQDLSQGLNLHRWEKKKKEGRTQPLNKHQGDKKTDASLLSSSPSGASSPRVSSASVSEPSSSSFVSAEAAETKSAVPWYVIAQQKREQTAAKRKPTEKLKTSPQKKASGSEKKKKKEKAEEKEGAGVEGEQGNEAIADKEKMDDEIEETKENDEDKVNRKQAKKEKKEAKREKKAQKKEKREKEKQDTDKKEKRKREPKTKFVNEQGGENLSDITKTATVTKKKKVNLESLVGGPAKPKTEYWYYCASKRPSLEQSNLGAQAINNELSEGWKNLPSDTKAEFEEYHARDKRRYARQLQEFTQYGSFTLEIEQCDDPNICEALAKSTQAETVRPMIEKQTQTTLNLDMFAAPPVIEVESKPRPVKRPGSFLRGAMKPVSRLS